MAGTSVRSAIEQLSPVARFYLSIDLDTISRVKIDADIGFLQKSIQEWANNDDMNALNGLVSRVISQLYVARGYATPDVPRNLEYYQAISSCQEIFRQILAIEGLGLSDTNTPPVQNSAPPVQRRRRAKKSSEGDPPEAGNPAAMPTEAMEVPVRALSDSYSSVDLLGYRDYVDALVNFIESPETQTPLSIGIDAPWGGGKTTLMRMLQQRLSPAKTGHE